MVDLKVRVGIADSEDPERVRRAVEFLVGEGVELEEGEGVVDHTALKRVRDAVCVKRIGKSVWGQLKKNHSGDVTRLLFNKQAAFVGKVALAEGESPMGAITIELPWDEKLLDWVSCRSSRPRRSRRKGP